jgi:hypothetical protein
LKNLPSDFSHRTPARVPLPGPSTIGWDEIAFLAVGLASGPRALRAATRKVTERYDLAPARRVDSRSGLERGHLSAGAGDGVLRGAQLITAELTRLTDAGLIDTRPGKDDRRKTELTLTSLGRAASDEIRQELSEIVRRRLVGFDAAEVRLAAEVLRAVSKEPDPSGIGSKFQREASMDRLGIEFISTLGMNPVDAVRLVAELGLRRTGMAPTSHHRQPPRLCALGFPQRSGARPSDQGRCARARCRDRATAKASSSCRG